jgi:hypothetical protein
VHYIQQEKAIKAGLNYFPKDPSLLRQSGISSMKMGILPAAEQIFRNLVEEDSENFLARYNLACVHALRSKRLACINTLEELFRFGEVHREWRANARIDPDFDNLWENDLFQRVLYPLNLL